MSGWQKAYQTFRLLGYACGLSGIALFMGGSRAEPPRGTLQAAGAWLLGAMLACFLGSYAVWGTARLRRK